MQISNAEINSHICPFCNIASNLDNHKNVIDQGEHVFVIPDIKPRSKGHALVITKKHFPNLSSTDDEALTEAILYAKKYANYLSSIRPEIKSFEYISNQGTGAFQVVFHLHIHVIPRT